MRTSAYFVTGMVGGDGVAAVVKHLSALPGVIAVSVNLGVGGDAQVGVTSQGAVPGSQVREAVRYAGYELVGAHRSRPAVAELAVLAS